MIEDSQKLVRHYYKNNHLLCVYLNTSDKFNKKFQISDSGSPTLRKQKIFFVSSERVI